MRVLITGTTGGIGGAMKAVAQAAGHEVIEINRGGFEAPLEGPFDALVFTTGLCRVKPLALMSDGEFDEALSVNCGLFVRLMRRIVREKLNRREGMKVVAISSVSATEGWAGGTAYCASKGALSAVCRALDAELKPKRISVTALEPHYVKTRMFDACAGRMGVDPALAIDPVDLAKEIMELL